MCYIDVRGEGRGVLPDAESAIQQVIALQKWSRTWTINKSFGQSLADRRAIDSAIKDKNHAAFKAAQRRGYWRVTLAQENQS